MDIVGEVGVSNFSMAAAARRTGVSSGAPFRHFADRDALLEAAALEATEEMVDHFAATVHAESDPVDQLVAIAAAYVRFASERGAAFDVIFASGLSHDEHPELAQSRRRLPDLVLPLAAEVASDMPEAMALMECHIALAHGYSALVRDQFLASHKADAHDVIVRASDAVRRLVGTYSRAVRTSRR